MSEFVARRIQDAAKKSLKDGQDKYRAYFVKLKLYEKWRPEVEALLIKRGYGDCIVTE